MDSDILITDGHNVSMRKTRQPSNCSMSSMRLDEIVAALMRPVKDINKENFDMNLSSLLEDYLTEAGLRQLEESETNVDILPNFAEVALILQQSVTIYCKKVDYLWLTVNDIAYKFGSERNNEEGVEEEPGNPSNQRTGRIRKKHVQLTDFQPIELSEASNITMRDNHDPKPLPLLPKAFIQFEPRVISENDVQIKDYKGEIIGVMNDFRVNWNTDEKGMLCDDLDFCVSQDKECIEQYDTASQLNSSLISPPDSGHNSDYGADYFTNNPSTPLPVMPDSDSPDGPAYIVPPEIPAFTDPQTSTPTPSLIPEVNQPELCVSLDQDLHQFEKVSKKRKLLSNTPIKCKNSKYDLSTSLTGTCQKIELIQKCFSLPTDMIRKIIDRRKNKIKKLKRQFDKIDVGDRNLETEYVLDAFVLQVKSKAAMRWYRSELMRGLKILSMDWDKDFHGFDNGHVTPSDIDITGFRGFTPEEAGRSQAKYARYSVLLNSAVAPDTSTINCEGDSDYEDDYGDAYCFLGTKDATYDPNISKNLTSAEAENPDQSTSEQSDVTKRVEAWHASIKEKLARAERRQKFDVWGYSSEILSNFKSKHSADVSFREVVKGKPQDDISRYFLATLMLANSGNVKISNETLAGAGNFQMHLLSMEKRFNPDDLPF